VQLLVRVQLETTSITDDSSVKREEIIAMPEANDTTGRFIETRIGKCADHRWGSPWGARHPFIWLTDDEQGQYLRGREALSGFKPRCGSVSMKPGAQIGADVLDGAAHLAGDSGYLPGSADVTAVAA
jgi:hypothetical protein